MRVFIAIAAAFLLSLQPRTFNKPPFYEGNLNRLLEQGRTMNAIDTATRVAWSFIGKPYIWGGDDPMAGFDCSGFVIEILKSVGKLPRAGDWTAAQLAEMFPRVAIPSEGCLVFYSSTPGGHIIHVEYVIDPTRSIGASGGGASTATASIASIQNAYIKVRPFASRDNIACFVNPFVL